MGCKRPMCSIKPRCYKHDPYEPPFYTEHEDGYEIVKDKNGYVIGVQEHLNGAMQIRNALDYYSKRRNKKMFDNVAPIDFHPTKSRLKKKL